MEFCENGLLDIQNWVEEVHGFREFQEAFIYGFYFVFSFQEQSNSFLTYVLEHFDHNLNSMFFSNSSYSQGT